MEGTARSSIRVASRQPSGPSLVEDIPVRAVRKNVDWVANKRFEISKFKFKFSNPCSPAGYFKYFFSGKLVQRFGSTKETVTAILRTNERGSLSEDTSNFCTVILFAVNTAVIKVFEVDFSNFQVTPCHTTFNFSM